MPMSDDDAIRKVLAEYWSKSNRKLDWVRFEQQLADVLNADLHESDIIRAAKELLDAFTRRGHFNPREYYIEESRDVSES